MSTTQPTRRHPLLDVAVSSLTDWTAWKLRWQEPGLTKEDRLGLLHAGFAIPAQVFYDPKQVHEVEVERTLFYLDLAEGQLQAPSEFVDTTGMTEWQAGDPATHKLGAARRALAQKAYAMLVQHLWRPALAEGPDSRHYWSILLQRPVVERLLEFFRVDYSFSGKPFLVNVGTPDRSESGSKHRWTRDFAHTLAAVIWDLPGERKPIMDFPEWLPELRFQALDLLNAAGLLDRLLLIDIDDITRPCWQRLEELALRKRHLPTPNSRDSSIRLPHSVNEAACFGSREAQLLLLLRNRREQIYAAG